MKPFALGQQGATLPGEFAHAPIGPTPVRCAGAVSSWAAAVWSWRAALACQLWHLNSQRMVNAQSCRLQESHKCAAKLEHGGESGVPCQDRQHSRNE